ncbi:MAG: ferrochelatase, partial [Eggerthellaceae bacterium]|nr:ferrochelatase [Eggerthellaceae bacterium]
VKVYSAMNYSSPFVRDAIDVAEEDGCESLIILPMYPQSAYSTTGAVKDSVEKAIRKSRWTKPWTLIDNYHLNQTYINAIAASIKNAGFNPNSSDRLLFSMHSVPLNDIEHGDTYELQADASCLAVANSLGIDRSRWTIGYQCRFDNGRKWLSPYTRNILHSWADDGVTDRVFIVCPGFSMECLETIYDLLWDMGPEYLDRLQKTFDSDEKNGNNGLLMKNYASGRENEKGSRPADDQSVQAEFEGSAR